MAAEIAEQPEMLQRILEVGDGEVGRVAQAIRDFAPRFVLLVARGTSDHAALYAKYLIESELKLPAGLVSMSTYTAYRDVPELAGVLWIALSQSGGSPDLAESTKMAAKAGALTVAITNNPDSLLASAAAQHLYMHAGPERAVAATKSYTATLLALLQLIMAVKGEQFVDVAPLPSLAADALDADVSDVAERYRFISRLVTTSRGYSYPTAREAGLKVMETCYLPAQAFSGADLLHGPLAMIDSGCPVLMILPDGRGGEALGPVIDALHERSADLCVVGAREPSQADAHIALPAGMDERLAPIVQIMPIQRLALAMSTGRGIDPDAPRGLKKVTETL